MQVLSAGIVYVGYGLLPLLRPAATVAICSLPRLPARLFLLLASAYLGGFFNTFAAALRVTHTVVQAVLSMPRQQHSNSTTHFAIPATLCSFII